MNTAKYQTRPVEVEAVQVNFHARLTLDRNIHGDSDEVTPGDWVVTYPDGHVVVMNDADFQANFVTMGQITLRGPGGLATYPDLGTGFRETPSIKSPDPRATYPAYDNLFMRKSAAAKGNDL